MDQKVTATLGPHMAQSHGCQLPNFDRRHASQFAPPSVFRQEPRRARPLVLTVVSNVAQQIMKWAVESTIAASIKAYKT